eukprot:c21718_g1_i1.p1 GENE.c21718_g1_i1~~c21718_g1_i1.p1  ORF type:complete len:445 (-),score=250.57 c21718_g1_i1:58-1392(-)
MRIIFVVVLLLVCGLQLIASEACKVTKVHAICESRCEQDTRMIDRVSVPPPGTLLPPTGMSQAADEGKSPQVNIQTNPTPADSSDVRASLLEIESQLEPAVTITKKKNGEFKPENVAKATYQVQVPKGVSDVQAARMVFPDHDIQNLNEVSASHFGQVESNFVSQPLSCEDVESHISPVQLLSWVDVRTASFGCVDGRSAEEGLGTWGGDFGEFVTSLNIYEQMTTMHLSQAEVTSIFRKYLESTTREKFTTCISGLAVRQMFGGVEDMRAAVMNPPEERRAALWMKISDSNFVGNEHIKFMLESPIEYSVRKELVQHLIHSFYDILWNQFDPLRSKLNVQVLPGDHIERAVVSISSPEFCLHEAHIVPRIAPKTASSSMAVIHPDAVQFLRRELSVFFSRETNPIVKADEMNKRFNVLAAGQGALTKKRMFDRIPSYSAKISE